MGNGCTKTLAILVLVLFVIIVILALLLVLRGAAMPALVLYGV
jgi:hypothetical protein